MKKTKGALTMKQVRVEGVVVAYRVDGIDDLEVRKSLNGEWWYAFHPSGGETVARGKTRGSVVRVAVEALKGKTVKDNKQLALL